MTRVALVTCLRLPEPDTDEELLIDALKDAGVHPEMLAWDDPSGDPAAFDLCVLRSCWNYYRKPDAFLTWVERAAAVSRLANPIEIVRWNFHKRYLRELEDARVPIVPTLWVDRGEVVDLHDTMRSRGWGEVVVKPAVSAASFRTHRFRSDEAEEGQAFLDSLLAERDAMVQLYMPSFESPGERALVYIDGQLTHAVGKHPRFAGAAEQVTDALPVTKKDERIAKQALSSVGSELLYARVDVVNDGDGTLLLSELELMEPSLFLLQCPQALTRLVDGIVRAGQPRR